MDVYTIGFTKKTAEEFFGLIRAARIERLVDVRLRNDSQLSGFAKKNDLAFFLRSLCGAEYRHEPLLAPTAEMLDAYRRKDIEWEEYERRYLALLAAREPDIEETDLVRATVLLCSEPTPDRCHRRLAAEWLQQRREGMTIRHL